ncbi:Rhamnosyltransferase WbbL [compost metagenome]
MLYISVISHGHGNIIEELSCLNKLSVYSDISVTIKDNLGDKHLYDFCCKNNINYISNFPNKGFGENNNIVFNSIGELNANDYFVVINPDVNVSIDTLRDAVLLMKHKNAQLGTINLYRDVSYSIYDNSIRKFPGLIDFVRSFLGFKNNSIIDKSVIADNQYVDWAAGSFLVFSPGLYKKLGGFNEKYFMYCEDVDICWRAKELTGKGVLYMPKLKGVHYAQHDNRKFFSKHFLWHSISALRFLGYRYGFLTLKSKGGSV